jgi:hypothetical protein
MKWSESSNPLSSAEQSVGFSSNLVPVFSTPWSRWHVTVSQKGGGSTLVKVGFTTSNVGSFSTNTTKFKVTKNGGPQTVMVTFTAGTSPGTAFAVMKANYQKVFLTAKVIEPTATPTPTARGGLAARGESGRG